MIDRTHRDILAEGSAVYDQLVLDGYRASISDKGRLWIVPALPKTHRLHPYRYDVECFLRAKCERCARPGHHGTTRLIITYWDEMICHNCADELGRPGGIFDRDNTWPADGQPCADPLAA